MSKNTATPGQIRTEMKELGANVLVVRWVRRINARSFGFWHFAVFKNIESALIFKLSEDVDELKKFESFFNPLKIK
ncbi:MAG: hypothetical protein HC836_26220 [Richelia sp. RM2_1_2]|nr:hypothetical protein [Richelia sp. RM2_1_2]